jgi:MOSC domain-containing protein YiiM
MKFTLGPVAIGRPVPFRGDEQSAIGRRAAEGPVAIGHSGLAGDEAADKVHHGGIDMAIHHYPHDHYPFWREFLDGHDLLEGPSAFGENISTTGLTEEDVWVGDRFRLGSALVEVTQGRKPCWKIDHKFGAKGITAKVVETGRCGWYYRVLEPGTVAEGDTFELVERGHEDWSVALMFRLLLHKGAETAALVAAARLDRLSQDWREKALEKAVFQEQQAHAQS